MSAAPIPLELRPEGERHKVAMNGHDSDGRPETREIGHLADRPRSN
jgi:hypothetical protein